MKNLKIFSGLMLSVAMAGIVASLFNLPFVAVLLFILVAGRAAIPAGSLAVVVSNPLIGKSRQSMGNATFSTWKGINVLKEKPTSVANPKSDGQVQQRSAFSQMVSAFRQMPAVVRAGFKKLAIKKSEFNAFMTANLDAAFNRTVAGVATLIPLNVLISRGTIAETSIVSAVADDSDNLITVGWSSTVLQPGQSNTDLALIAAYNSTLNDWIGGVTAAPRMLDEATLAIPASWVAGNNIVIYLGFYNQLSGESSDSVAVARVIQA